MRIALSEEIVIKQPTLNYRRASISASIGGDASGRNTSVSIAATPVREFADGEVDIGTTLAKSWSIYSLEEWAAEGDPEVVAIVDDLTKALRRLARKVEIL
jgi:hypothetical protein